VVETGERLVFTTFDLGRPQPGSQSFAGLYPSRNFDIPITTAVRLSATFPVVTPAARADADLPRSERYHIVDGGYYDNYGIASMVDFLNQALTESGKIRRVLVLQIQARTQSPHPKVTRNKQGWQFQLAVPLTTLASVRDSAQAARNRTELELLAGAKRTYKIDIWSVTFAYPAQDVPLSWHLTPKQVKDIEEGWHQRFEPDDRASCEVEAVRDFVRGNIAPTREMELCQSQTMQTSSN
jgi:hypothetical protein